MKRKGIIFDLDGTLWDVTESTYNSVNLIAKKYKLPEVSVETICSVFGLNKEDSAKTYFPSLDTDKALKVFTETTLENIKNLKTNGGLLYPDLESTLIKLEKKYKLFIVSNTSLDEYIEAFLISSKLKKYFSGYIAASKLNLSKAAAIQKIIDDYHLEQAVYVGDTRGDFKEVKSAHVPFIQARYGFDRKLNTKYYIDSLKELPKVIKEVL